MGKQSKPKYENLSKEELENSKINQSESRKIDIFEQQEKDEIEVGNGIKRMLYDNNERKEKKARTEIVSSDYILQDKPVFKEYENQKYFGNSNNKRMRPEYTRNTE